MKLLNRCIKYRNKPVQLHADDEKYIESTVSADALVE